ncbi:MAG: efflux RND transporter permease subunit, partial [Shimia sp.]
VALGVVGFVVATTFVTFGANNNGVEFFVESEPEQAQVYVRARGNLSLEEKDALLRDAERILLDHPAVQSTFSFAGEGGLNANTGGAAAPLDTIGQAQIELIPWEDRPTVETETELFGFLPFTVSRQDERFDGDTVLAELQASFDQLPGVEVEILNLAMGPASGKPVHLRLKGDDWEALMASVATARAEFEATPGLITIEDNRPLPGIDWQIDVDTERAGRYGADVATVGGMVQLVTRGITLDTMRVDSSDEEIDIRVRFPEEDRVLSTLDTLKVRTPAGLVPLSNFVTREPVARVGQINRVDGDRYFDVKADVTPGLVKFTDTSGGGDAPRIVGYGTEAPEGAQGNLTLGGTAYDITETAGGATFQELAQLARDDALTSTPVTPNERIEVLNEWLDTRPLASGVDTEWTGDQEDQAESGAFLMNAFAGALGLMFIILLAQFNSFYNAVLVLLAVVLSTTGVLIGMLVMDQAFSIIMTGTGIVALAGIVVNNNIVLIDTYQEYSRYMPRLEAIVRTAEARIRPVLLTTITTMAGLTPMMFGLSLDFIGGGYTIESPTALWWIQLATAVVWGLGVATVLTLMFTPSMLALRVWVSTYALWLARLFGKLSMGRSSAAARDWALTREARQVRSPTFIWDDEPEPVTPDPTPVSTGRPVPPLKAAE